MDFPRQLVWPLTLAVGTSSLCHNVQQRLPEGLESSLGKRLSKPANTRSTLNVISMPLRPGLYVTLWAPFSLLSQMQETMCGQNMTLRAAWENGGCKSSLVNQELKKIEETPWAGNFALHLSHRTKILLTRPPVLCLTLIVPCPRRHRPEFKWGLDHIRLTWFLWTATVAEEWKLVITPLGRLHIF